MSSPSSSDPNRGRKPALGLDELAAFCRELASLVRAGIPLGVGLRSGAFAWGSSMNRAAARLATLEEKGRSLPEALASESATWPPAMRAVVECGAATGHLSEALDAVARCAQRQADARVRIGAALVYPAVLLVTASWLLAIFLPKLVAGIAGVYDTGPFGKPGWLAPLSAFAGEVWIGSWVVPAIVLLSVVVWRIRGQRGNAGAAVVPLVLRVVPGLWTLERNLRLGLLSDFLALLTTHGVPLPQAWALAAESTGHRRTFVAGAKVAEAVSSGKPQGPALRATGRFPELFCGIVESAERQGGLPAAFRQLAETYSRRADRQSEWARATLPILLTATFGAGLVTAYAAVVFLPTLQMIFDLVKESA